MLRRPTLITAAALVLINVIAAADATAGQPPPPIHGVTGTVATEETVKDVHDAGRGILERVARLFRLNRRSPDSSDKAAAELFAGLTAGTAVIVQNATEGKNLAEIDRQDRDGGSRMEGVITAVDPSARTISLRLVDGTRQTLRLSDEGDKTTDSTATRVVVFLKDGGERVVHYFKRVS
jgi:hypothetical protein